MSQPSESIQPLLFASDFDGTIARTFDPSPNNLTVHSAYEAAIIINFGSVALDQYRDEGGLRNRAPSEIIDQLQPSADPSQRSADTEALIETKMRLLMGEIGVRSGGQVWPRPMPGFLPFWDALQAAKLDRAIDTAIVSSGHTPFIEKVFATWQVAEPDIIVSDDTIRGLPDGCRAKGAVKPSPLLMRMVEARWLALRPGQMAREALHDRIIYTGDDSAKDGGLAANSDVAYVHITPETAPAAWQHVLDRFGIVTLGAHAE